MPPPPPLDPHALNAAPKGDPPSLDSTDSLRKALQANQDRAEATTQVYARDTTSEAPTGSTTSLNVALGGAGLSVSRLRALVVDRDPAHLDAFQRGLAGSILATVSNFTAARHLLTLESWDVVFLDLCEGAGGNGLHLVRFLCERPHQTASSLFVVHSLDPCGPQMATMLRDGGFRVVQRAFAWLEVPLLRRLVRERRWPCQERRDADGFAPPLVLHLPGYG